MENNAVTTKIHMAQHLFDDQRRFDSLHLEGKCKQYLKRCTTKCSHHETHESGIKQILTPTQNAIKCSKNY